MRRTSFLRTARLLVGVALLALLLHRVDLAEIAALGRHGDSARLAFGILLLAFANPVLQALRLHVLVARYTGGVATTFKIFLIGAFFNLMLPSNVGGDAVKLVYLRRMKAESWAAPFALLMLHRVTGMLSLVLASAGYALIYRERVINLLREADVRARLPFDARAVVLLAAALAATAVLVVLLGERRRTVLRAKVTQFAGACWGALQGIGLRAAFWLLALTLLFHCVRMWAFCELVAYAGAHLAFADSLIVLTATAVAGVIPITVGGLGLMEGAVSVTLLLYGVPESAGLVVGLANRLVLLLGAAGGGLINLTYRTPLPEDAREVDARSERL